MSTTDDEPDPIPKVAEMNQVGDGCLIQIEEDKAKSLTNSTENKPDEDFQEADNNVATTQVPENRLPADADGGSMTPLPGTRSDPKTELTRVAFVSVKRPSPSKPTDADVHPKKTRREDERKEDPFFNLLTGGYLRDDDSLF